MFLHYSVHKLCPTVHTFASSPQVSATHQRLVLELSDLHAESTDCGEDEQGSATASNGGVSTVGGGGGGRGTFDPDFVRHGSGMIFSTLQTWPIIQIFLYYREVQLDFTPEMEVFYYRRILISLPVYYMLFENCQFERYPTKNRK